MSDLRLVIFDVDGTLVDSQADILRAMQEAFGALDLPAPPREAVLSIVGLSLPQAIAELAPDQNPETQAGIVTAYKDAYASHRRMGATSPLYPGIAETLAALNARETWLLGVATGKSRRGLTALLDAHGMRNTFVTEQVSDFHPSKPHPAMLHAALSETGLDPEHAVMVGDTSFDMEMARAAGIFAIGVSWGYHPRERLGAADVIIDQVTQLPGVLEQYWGFST
ncbi:HAD-IA family hydrolase [Primorskyibacter aestuariivivens]|uniref:HAD-IA family hydrolase n=1 Tax=Primorskyibacter aestuariivivens TaxID=1888912 RepID=UPI0023004E2D|nr:HAD-IA family hydrolase [Primorskyibacter aestuariivivens]MDA7430407.1 HAD-IA family hydrolase [Primorskyibacter aestuariivivens]